MIIYNRMGLMRIGAMTRKAKLKILAGIRDDE
jgi:hypothetical protein